MRRLRRSVRCRRLVLSVALAVALTQQSSTGAPKHEMTKTAPSAGNRRDAEGDQLAQHRELDPQARQLRHPPHAVLADRSRARHRRRAGLALRGVLALRGGVGRPHDRREADVHPAGDAAAGPRGRPRSPTSSRRCAAPSPSRPTASTSSAGTTTRAAPRRTTRSVTPRAPTTTPPASPRCWRRRA